MDEERFLVEFLTKNDYEEVHRLQVDVFTEQNAETVGCKVSRWAWDKFSRWLNGGWEKVGLTQIVRDKEADNKVVAFLFCKELNVLEPFLDNSEALVNDSPGMKWMLEHGGSTVEKSRAVPRLGPVLAIETGGTMLGYEGLGIATHLRRRLCELAQQRGFRRITVETSSMATRHIYRDKLGFKTLAESRYVDWQSKDGTYPFRQRYKLPGDFVFTCHHKVFESPRESVECPQKIVVSGAGSAEVNGVYVRCPGSRGPHHSKFDAWVHSAHDGCFLANSDFTKRGHPEWNKWTIYWPRGVCYAKHGAPEEVPPRGKWELAPWAKALFRFGKPGLAPAPEIILEEGDFPCYGHDSYDKNGSDSDHYDFMDGFDPVGADIEGRFDQTQKQKTTKAHRLPRDSNVRGRRNA